MGYNQFNIILQSDIDNNHFINTNLLNYQKKSVVAILNDLSLIILM
jgi:hypothetical protein